MFQNLNININKSGNNGAKEYLKALEVQAAKEAKNRILKSDQLKAQGEKAMWNYALSHGICVEFEQVSFLKVKETFEKITANRLLFEMINSAEISSNIEVVTKCLHGMSGTGKISDERLHDMSAAVGAIEGHLSKHGGNSQLPIIMHLGRKIASLKVMPISLVGCLFSIISALIIYSLRHNMDTLIAGTTSMLIPMYFFIKYPQKRRIMCAALNRLLDYLDNQARIVAVQQLSTPREAFEGASWVCVTADSVDLIYPYTID